MTVLRTEIVLVAVNGFDAFVHAAALLKEIVSVAAYVLQTFGHDTAVLEEVVSIVDRKEAIRTACMMADKGDVILIAGKGHEDYQEIKGVKHHFDDKEVVREIFGN